MLYREKPEPPPPPPVEFEARQITDAATATEIVAWINGSGYPGIRAEVVQGDTILIWRGPGGTTIGRGWWVAKLPNPNHGFFNCPDDEFRRRYETLG